MDFEARLASLALLRASIRALSSPTRSSASSWRRSCLVGGVSIGFTFGRSRKEESDVCI